MDSDIMRKIIHYATLAPSGHNTQPWVFSIENDCIEIRPDYKRTLPVVDPDNHALFISLGCALENLTITSNHLGFTTNIKFDLSKDRSEVIYTELSKSDQAPEQPLFDSISKRQTTRKEYDGKPISDSDILSLKKISNQDDVIVKIFTKEKNIESLLPFVEEANILQFNNEAFVDELVSWIRFSNSDAQKKRDGLRSAVMGAPSVPQWFGRLIMKFYSGKKEAKKCRNAIRSSSGLVLFISVDNTKKNWINVGRSFERFTLKATQLGIKHAHLNMPCEEIEVRKKLQNHLGLRREQQPLLMLRMGYSDPMPESFRRSVEEVIVK